MRVMKCKMQRFKVIKLLHNNLKQFYPGHGKGPIQTSHMTKPLVSEHVSEL